MIELADGLALPDSAVTNSYALLAMKGAGKSNAAVVFAEQLFDAGIPWVAIDPKGDWWGIRSSATGKGDGLPVPIFGGVHADVPIDPNAGVLFADLIVDQHLTCLIDTSELTKGESIRFLTAFFDRLYRRKNRATYPMHLFLEECDDYVPQKVYGDISQLVRTVELVVKRGRARGLGITLASQRAASINKDVLTQTDTLIALRNTSPQDTKAIGQWIAWHAGSGDIIRELPTLQDGEAWVSSPAQLRILERVRFRRRRTFDSGATPELGEKVKPATLADIDVAAITAAVGDLVERATADDPKKLRARIRELERKLAETDKQRVVEPEVRVETVEVPIVPVELRNAIERIRGEARSIAGSLTEAIDVAVSLAELTRAPVRTERPQADRPAPNRRHETGRVVASRREPRPSTDGAKLGKRERAVLTVLAQQPGRTRRQLSMLTGYSVQTSTLGVALSTLRAAGYIDDQNAATPAGVDALGDTYEPLPTGPALLDHWNRQLDKRCREVLAALLDVYPDALTRNELSERTGYSMQTSTLGVGLSKLRGLEIIERVAGGERVTDDFAVAIER